MSATSVGADDEAFAGPARASSAASGSAAIVATSCRRSENERSVDDTLSSTATGATRNSPVEPATSARRAPRAASASLPSTTIRPSAPRYSVSEARVGDAADSEARDRSRRRGAASARRFAGAASQCDTPGTIERSAQRDDRLTASERNRGVRRRVDRPTLIGNRAASSPAAADPDRTDTCRAAGTARGTRSSFARSSFTPSPGAVGTAIVPRAVLHLSADDHVVESDGDSARRRRT